VNPESSEVQRLQSLRDEVHRLKREESLLDRNYQLAQTLLKSMSEDEYNQKLAYLTHTDIRNIAEFGEETLLAVKAPYGSTLEVPDPDEVRTHANIL
jgi:transcription factor E2F3